MSVKRTEPQLYVILGDSYSDIKSELLKQSFESALQSYIVIIGDSYSDIKSELLKQCALQSYIEFNLYM